jgi:predicted DNA-binding ribbon-helix-helix protein
MCGFFVKADPILYESRSRTIRIHGVLTSIRLENLAWDVLAEMAASEGCTTNNLIATFHDEILEHRGEVQNFASFLRVTCMRYLQRESQVQARPAALAQPEAQRDGAPALESGRRNVVPLAAGR